MSHPADDPSILDADPLWRRIHHSWLVPDGAGGRRLSSAAFDNSSDGSGMSVTLAREAREAGVTPARELAPFPGLGLAELSAGVCRVHDQWLEREPVEQNLFHALVNGAKPKRVQKALARAAQLVIEPRSVGER